MTAPQALRQLVLMGAMTVFAVLPGGAASQENVPANPASRDLPETHLGKGYEALKQERYDVAEEEFRAALALDPKLTLRARFPLAVSLFELHKPDEARRELETVRRETGDHPNILYYLGRMDIDDRNFEGAIRNLNNAAAKPPFPDTAYYLGFAYFKHGDLKLAEKWLKDAARANPQDSRVPYQLAFVYRKEGREEEAKKALALSDELRHNKDNDSRLKMDCGQKLDQGLRDEAHALCDQLYDDNNAEKLTALGTIYGQHGDLEAALKPLQRAAQLSPQAPQMQYNLALVYFQMNQFERAKGALVSAVPRWPDLFPLNALYGATLLKLGEAMPARDALAHAHQLNPQDVPTSDMLYLATLGVAREHLKAHRYGDSLRYFTEAANLKPQEPAPHHGMAEIYEATGRTAEGQVEEQKAKALSKAAGLQQ